MTSPSFGLKNGIINYSIEQIGSHGLGISLDAGVFSILSANGGDLSNLNPGFVCIPNGAIKGLLNTYMLTANQSFNDSASGGSTIIGNLFGTASGDTWNQDVPFYLYACIDNSNTTPVFGISRIPNLSIAPTAGNIGTPSSVTCNVSYGMFIFKDVTISDYDLNPVVCVGSFRMRKNSSNDWTVQALNNSDGFGRFQDDKIFIMPTGVNGNALGKYFIDNTGTAPAFNSNFVTYTLSRSGSLWFNSLMFNNSPGTSGVGAVDLTHNLVIEASNVFGQNLYSGYGSYQNSPGNPFFNAGPVVSGTNVTFRLNNGTTTVLQNSNFPNTTGYSIAWSYQVPVRTS